jgi:hypothetical protein
MELFGEQFLVVVMLINVHDNDNNNKDNKVILTPSKARRSMHYFYNLMPRYFSDYKLESFNFFCSSKLKSTESENFTLTYT